jgi:hypothetical protein
VYELLNLELIYLNPLLHFSGSLNEGSLALKNNIENVILILAPYSVGGGDISCVIYG